MSVGTWLIVGGAMLYSVLTVTPLMAAHTAAGWRWTAPILPLVVDAAVVIVVRLDSVLARLGGHGGAWPVALRWMTGAMTLALNIGVSALAGDLVGVAVHAVAPLLLIVTAEAGLAYRRALTAAVLAVEARQRAEQDARDRAAAEREENRLRAVREQREHEAAIAREQREHEAALAREEAERQDRIRREEAEQAEAADRAEREAAERREQIREQQQAERERLERQATQQRELEAQQRAERERREQAREQERIERERAALLAAGPPAEKLGEDRARQVVQAAFAAGLPVRVAAELTGWSVGWASARYQEQRELTAPTPRPALEGATP
ncbi:SpdB [Streptomyces sp. XY593]|nr:SpdB [Streptomyces sp. XY593]